MNVYTVRLATQALANTLLAKGNHTKGVAIAYDSRRMSKEFAETAAQVLCGQRHSRVPVYGDCADSPVVVCCAPPRYCRRSGDHRQPQSTPV